MRILLINPPRYSGVPVIREERCEITERYSVLEPYSLMQLASILRQDGHEVGLMDANGLNQDYNDMNLKISNFKPDILIFRFTPTTFNHDIKTSTITKKFNNEIKVIGLCWTLISMFKEVLDSAPAMDFYITGEYETIVPILIENIQTGDDNYPAGVAWRNNKEIFHTVETESKTELDKLPIPAYDLLPSLEPYFINTPSSRIFTIMYTSRGCPYNCIYCTVGGTKWKARTAESVAKELKYLKKNYNVELVSFFDETFTIDKQRVLDICSKINSEKLEIEWYCNTRANLLDEEILMAMRSAGCSGFSLGVESGSQKILDTASKGIKVDDARTAIKLAKKHGIKVFCSFIFGLPGENWNTVHETIDFVKDTLPTGVQFNVAVPYPGTKLHEWAIKKGFLKNMDWKQLFQHDSIAGTDEMTPDDLNKARLMAYKAVYLNPSWYIENVKYVLNNPNDVNLAFNYTIKIINNYFFKGMKHSH